MLNVYCADSNICLQWFYFPQALYTFETVDFAEITFFWCCAQNAADPKLYLSRLGPLAHSPSRQKLHGSGPTRRPRRPGGSLRPNHVFKSTWAGIRIRIGPCFRSDGVWFQSLLQVGRRSESIRCRSRRQTRTAVLSAFMFQPNTQPNRNYI